MSEHVWIRTVPTDGRWCEACGLAEARWSGDPCPGEGAAREVERRMIEQKRELARDVLEMARLGGMPRSYWLTDSRIAGACDVLGVQPADAMDA